jgi:formylglycine-generating enzyme required for sulfatase activity
VILADRSAIYVQKYEVTVAEWNKCNAAGRCSLALHTTGNHTEADMPATGLSFIDVFEYITWINATTRMEFRLPTLAEWEHMAAAVLPPIPDPIFTDPELTWASAYLMEPQTKRTLRPRGTFETTSEGIVDLNGSVWEWTQDCYAGADSTLKGDGYCPAYFVGGEHIAAVPFLVRDPARGGCAVGSPPAHLGMRLVSDRAF